MVDFGRVAARNLILGAQNTASQTALALNAAMVMSTSGPAIAYRFVATRSADLTDVYLFVTATTGSPTAIRCEIRAYTSATLPGSSLGYADIDASGGGTPRWHHVTFGLPVALTEGATYYLVIHNATGTPASNHATIAYLGPMVNGENFVLHHRPLNTSNGFTSATSNANGGIVVMKLSDGTLIGQALTQNASDANNALERGIYIPGIDESIEIGGLAWAAMLGVTSVHLRRAEKAPGASATAGSEEFNQTLAQASIDSGETRWTPRRLRRRQAYRLTLRMSGLATGPGYYEVQDAGRYSDVDGCVIGGGSFAHCIDNGAGGWTDTLTRWPRMQLLLTGVPARAFCGGRQ